MFSSHSETVVLSDMQIPDEGGVARSKAGKELCLNSTLNLYKQIHQALAGLAQ